MSFKATVFKIMVASPGDVIQERQIVREEIETWNAIHSTHRSIVLMPITWERNTTPEMHKGGAQEVINKQILNSSDLLIGIFWTRLGSPTGRSESGTVEEIEEHIKSGKPTMLYFSKNPVDLEKVDHEQYEKLKQFKKKYFQEGLVVEYNSLDDFRKKISAQLSLKLNNDSYFKEEAKPTENERQNENSNQIQYIISKLLPIEKELLVLASEDNQGQIIFAQYMGGFEIQTNGMRLNTDEGARTKSRYQSALQKLRNFSLIQDLGGRGEVFTLTSHGFDLADELKENKEN